MRKNDKRDGKLAGQRIKASRKATGLTQEQLGKKIGLSKGVISIFERDARHGDAFKFAKLCCALNLDVEKVFEPEEENYSWRVESTTDITDTLRNQHHYKLYGAVNLMRLTAPYLSKFKRRCQKQKDFIFLIIALGFAKHFPRF